MQWEEDAGMLCLPCWCPAADALLVMPQRKAPPARLVNAALTASNGAGSTRAGVGGDDDDEEPDAPAQLPPGAPAWEVRLIAWLRLKHVFAPWVMEWVVLVRPLRILLLLVRARWGTQGRLGWRRDCHAGLLSCSSSDIKVHRTQLASPFHTCMHWLAR